MKWKTVSVLLALLFSVFGLSACTDDASAGETPSEGNAGGGDLIYSDGEESDMNFFFTVGTTKIAATLEKNSATAALIEKLKNAPITVEMTDYGGWEKVGELGFRLPTSDVQMTAQPCDFVLYQGNKLVVFYGTNSWSYTRLGKITGLTPIELKAALGDGDVTLTMSIAD